MAINTTNHFCQSDLQPYNVKYLADTDINTTDHYYEDDLQRFIPCKLLHLYKASVLYRITTIKRFIH